MMLEISLFGRILLKEGVHAFKVRKEMINFVKWVFKNHKIDLYLGIKNADKY